MNRVEEVERALEALRQFRKKTSEKRVEGAIHQLFAITQENNDHHIQYYKQLISELKDFPERQPSVFRLIEKRFELYEEEAKEIINTILTSLFGSPLGKMAVEECFWTTPIGEAIRQLQQGFPEVLLTAGDAAALLGVSRQYIHEEMKNGKLPYQQVGKYGILKLSDVLIYQRGKKQ